MLYPGCDNRLATQRLNLLADGGLLDKRRGIGMFVASGARKQLLAQRRDQFASHYVEPLLTEAARLGIGTDELVALVRESTAALPLNTQGGVTV
jgi:DNA-binding transcriptional regulator YhcF (GntR family)